MWCMGVKNRICQGCGKIERTASRALKCRLCFEADKTADRIVEERKLLEGLYEEVDGPLGHQHNHRLWSFVHAECGTRQTWTLPNIRKQLNLRPDKVPCSHCGSKERIKPAMDAYIEKYGRDFDVTLWEEYRTKVRRLTEKTYKQHKFEINPLNLKRGVRTFHLDHRMPIIEGFLQGIPAEQIAAKENLQILPAFDNLSKGRG